MASVHTLPRPPRLPDAAQAWEEIRAALLAEYGERTFNSWLKAIRLLRIEGDEAVLALDTRFTCEWVRNNYAGTLRTLWNGQGLGVRSVRLIVEPAPTADVAAALAPAAPAQTVAVEPDFGCPLEARFRFETFLTGQSNEFAYKAATAVAEGAPAGFNPLFLHSVTGLGKTHLMHAIGHAYRDRHPNARVAYMSAEKFMVEFFEGLRAKNTLPFKQRLRALDLLLIDDVQFIAGKESTQEEFFHTVNELITAGRKVVISADRPPRDLTNVQERIQSRLSGGLVADVRPADYELRLNILYAKLDSLGYIQAPREVMEFLARRISSNVRELEGALNRVAACASLQNKAITLEFASTVLADVLRVHDRRITVEEIQRRTAEHYKLKMSDLLSPCRAREFARPRQVAMYVAKKMTQRSLPEIGRRFGGRDHTTVLHAVKRIEDLRSKDRELDGDVTKLMRSLES